MSEGKVLNRVPTKLVEKAWKESLLPLQRTFFPAAWDRRVLGIGLHRLPCHKLIPFHTKLVASGPPERALTIQGSWCHHVIRPQPVSECLPLQKHTWTASGEGEHISLPWCEVFAGRKITNASAMRREASTVPVRTTLAFFKGTKSPTLGFFSSSSEMCLKRDGFWEAESESKSPAFPGRRDYLPALFYKLMTLSSLYELPHRVWSLPCFLWSKYIDVLVVM